VPSRLPQQRYISELSALGCLEGPEGQAGTLFENTGLPNYRGGNNGTRPLEVRNGFEYTPFGGLSFRFKPV
jgi:hypothetical protein